MRQTMKAAAIVAMLGLAGSAAAQLVPVTPGAPPAGGGLPPGGIAPPAGGGIVPGTPGGGAGSQQQALDKAFKDYFVGHWTVTFTNPMQWRVTSDVYYRADGSLAGVQTTVGQMTQQTPLKGTWSLIALDQSNFALTLNIVGNTGPSTDTITMIDQNTVFSQTLQTNVTRVP